MKRPVFWAVVMFALGEVTGLFVRTWKQLGIAVAMLICVVGIMLWIAKKLGARLSKLVTVLLAFFAAVGCIFSVLRSGNYHYFGYAKAMNAAYGCEITSVAKAVCKADEVTVCGTVKSVSETSITNVTLQVESIIIRDKNTPIDYVGPLILASIKAPNDDIQIGDQVRIDGAMSMILPPENPGQFDLKTYYLARKIRYQIKADSVTVLEKRATIKQSIFDVRAYMKACIYDSTDEETAALYSGMLLGDKSTISDATKRLFSCAGIAHVLSISALHISLVAMTFYRLLRRCGVHFAVACPCAGVLVALYGTLTGWSFSAVRAAIMLTLVLLGELLGRKVDLLTSASMALFVMSVSSPYLLFDGGVCIGFAAVVGIAIGQEYNRAFRAYYKIRQRQKIKHSGASKSIEAIKQKYYQKFIGALIMSASISIITAPVLARSYYFVNTYSIFVNLLIVPLMTVVIMLGMIGLLFACLQLPIGGAFFQLGGYVLGLFRMVCKLVIRLPFATIKTGKITLKEVALYYVFVAVVIYLSTKHFRKSFCKSFHKITYKWIDKTTWKRVLLCIYVIYLACAGFVMVSLRMRCLQEEIIFLSVGQGDGILLRTEDGCNIVIDGGSTSKEALGENILMPAILSQSMFTVDYWIVSHADKDHISGLETVIDMGDLSQINIKNIVVARAAANDKNTQKLIQKAYDCNIEVLYMEQGNRIVGGKDFEITCVGPATAKQVSFVDDRNEISLCFIYESKHLFALFTGDASAEEMESVSNYMMEEYYKKTKEKALALSNKKTILKVPHHGSKNSCIEDFYGNFDIAVISCGRNNLYGHPHAEMLELLEHGGCEIMRTDEQGAIVIR